MMKVLTEVTGISQEVLPAGSSRGSGALER
jgi:hypothetical protein